MEVHYTLPGIDFPILVSSRNEKNFSNVTLFDRECAARVSLAVWVLSEGSCECVRLCFIIQKDRTRLHTEESAVDISEEIGTRVSHTHTYTYAACSPCLGSGGGLRGELNAEGDQ